MGERACMRALDFDLLHKNRVTASFTCISPTLVQCIVTSYLLVSLDYRSYLRMLSGIYTYTLL